MTNGEDLRVIGYMKPIATLMKPLRSVDLTTMTESPAAIERSDVCAVPAAAVVGEAMVAIVLAEAVLEKFGGDSMDGAASRTGARSTSAHGGSFRVSDPMIRPILRYGDQRSTIAARVVEAHGRHRPARSTT